MLKREKQKGDRRDAYLVRDADALHAITPFLLPNRCDNECVMNVDYDMTAVLAYLDKKNAADPEHKYTLFHMFLAGYAKIIYLRPNLNRFYANGRLYDRDNISFSFVAKNKMTDSGSESLVMVTAEETGQSLLDQIHDKVCDQVYKIREEGEENDTGKVMDLITKLPRPVLSAMIAILTKAEDRDLLPQALFNVNPYKVSVFVSNLGSIRLHADYHHLTNFSTNSIFIITNRMEKKPIFNDDGSYEMKDIVPMSFTVDERIADGFYFAHSMALLQKIFLHPELLDDPLATPIDAYIDPEHWFD
jgi:pyruvate/2-oxoglutarate dehydrogenase complex dihydrolipoamide acyltransferase (E2) component